jgi:hypothetical protein
MAATGALALEVEALVAGSLDGLTAGELQERMVAVTPLVGRLQGWVQTAAGRLEALVGGTLPAAEGGRGRSVAGWLAEVQRSTPSSAGRSLRTSAALRAVPAVVDAVLDGRLTPEQAGVLARLVGKIDADALVESQPDLVTVAAGMDPVQLGSWVAHLIATHCEPALDQAADRGRDKRYLQTSRDADGCVRGRFVLAGEDSEAVLTALEPLARRQGNDDVRSAGQRRADALVEVCEQVLRFGQLPDAGGQRPQLSYVLPADWAAGQFAQAACPDCGPRCAAHSLPSFADTVHACVPDAAPSDTAPSDTASSGAAPRRPAPARPAQRAVPTQQARAGSRRAPPCPLSTPARSGPGAARRPARASRRCCARPGSPWCCSTTSGRSPGWSR